MPPTSHLRRFVDRDLSKVGLIRSGGRSILIAGLIVMLPIPFVDRPYDAYELTAIIAAACAGILWLSLVAWRGWRIARAISVKADRGFDRHEKFKLASEYHDAESATKATQRKGL
jgi:hypothetical protein